MVEFDFKLYDGLKIEVLKVEESEHIEKSLESFTILSEEPITQESFIKVMINNKIINLPKREDNPYIFADMLNYADIDPSNPKGNIVLLHNNKEASYLNFISDNDVIIIKWDCE